MKMTYTDVLSAIGQALGVHPLAGAKFDFLEISEQFNRLSKPKGLEFFRPSIRWEQAWAIEASMDLRFAVEEQEQDGRRRFILRTGITINSPATTRSIAQTIAFAALLRNVTEIAALIESSIDGVELVASYDSSR